MKGLNTPHRHRFERGRRLTPHLPLPRLKRETKGLNTPLRHRYERGRRA